MAENTSAHDVEERLARLKSRESDFVHMGEGESKVGANTLGYSYSSTLLRDPNLNGRGNHYTRAKTLHAAQHIHGNRAVQRYIRDQLSPTPVQRAPDDTPANGIWDWTKKLIGVDQIGPGVKKVTDTAKSGYETIEKKLFNILGLQTGGKQPDPELAGPVSNNELQYPNDDSNWNSIMPRYNFYEAWPQ